MLTYKYTAPATTGTITVTKVEVPAGTTVFDFTTVGMAPAAFTLVHGDSRVFADLAPGTYGVAELAELGYTTVITVSNGDLPNAIGLAAGEEVTVTVTNTLKEISGVYYINPGKTGKHDSYYNDVEKKIPDPTVKTALIGE
jgi:uncharacterized OB-fold protein